MVVVRAERSYSTFYFLSTANTSFGTHIEIRFKACCYDCGQVFWELRRISAALLEGKRHNLQTNIILRRNRPVWEKVLASLGCAWSECIKPSLTVAMAAGLGEQRDDFVREGYSLSTLSLVAILTVMSRDRHDVQERLVASAVLVALLSKTCKPAALSYRFLQDRLLMDCAQDWRQEPLTSGTCAHVSSFMQSFQELGGNDLFANGVQALRDCLIASHTCAALAPLLRSWLRVIAEGVDKAIPSLRLNDNPLGQETFTFGGHTRRLRVDEDYRVAVSRDLVKRRRVHSGAQYLRAASGFDDSLSRKWDAKELLRYQASCHRHNTFDKVHVFCLVDDASRVGEPAQKTVLFLVWNAQEHVGMFPPPQAAEVDALLVYPPFGRSHLFVGAAALNRAPALRTSDHCVCRPPLGKRCTKVVL